MESPGSPLPGTCVLTRCQDLEILRCQDVKIAECQDAKPSRCEHFKPKLPMLLNTLRNLNLEHEVSKALRARWDFFYLSLRDRGEKSEAPEPPVHGAPLFRIRMEKFTLTRDKNRCFRLNRFICLRKRFGLPGLNRFATEEQFLIAPGSAPAICCASFSARPFVQTNDLSVAGDVAIQAGQPA